MSIVGKDLVLLLHTNPATGQYDVDLADRVRCFVMQNKANMIAIRIKQIADWDIEKMRNYLHGVVVRAFTQKYNETHPGGRQGVYTERYIKMFLKAKFLGFGRSEAYTKLERQFGLDVRPADLLDWNKLLDEECPDLLKHCEPVSTEAISAERYWNFLNALESYYFALWHEMFDKREKPVWQPPTVSPEVFYEEF